MRERERAASDQTIVSLSTTTQLGILELFPSSLILSLSLSLSRQLKHCTCAFYSPISILKKLFPFVKFFQFVVGIPTIYPLFTLTSDPIFPPFIVSALEVDSVSLRLLGFSYIKIAFLRQDSEYDAKKEQFHLDDNCMVGLHIDMEAQIHILEQEAYSAVLRAFKAQSDAISWDKESMITELRKELRVSDDEHRELLNNVHNDDIIKRIRDWRQGGGNQFVRTANNQSLNVLPSPTFSASRKKQKTFQSYPSIGSTRNRSFNNRVVSAANEPAEALIGRKVWTKWPEDNSFYEAVVTQYNAQEGRHALVYDLNTASETWEWVDLKEIPPEDIRWDGEENGVTLNVGHGGGITRGSQRTLNHGGRGRGPRTQPRRDHLAMQNGGGRKFFDEIELFNTDSLVKEVERVFDSNLPDPLELDKAKKLLKEHEQALIAAIARLADASDYESDGEEPYSHELPMLG